MPRKSKNLSLVNIIIGNMFIAEAKQFRIKTSHRSCYTKKNFCIVDCKQWIQTSNYRTFNLYCAPFLDFNESMSLRNFVMLPLSITCIVTNIQSVKSMVLSSLIWYKINILLAQCYNKEIHSSINWYSIYFKPKI